MGRIGKRLVAVSLVSALLLSGCSSIDMSSYPNLQKVATEGFASGLSESADSIQNITENVAEITSDVTESVAELNETVAETVETATESVGELTEFVTDESIAEVAVNAAELAAEVQTVNVEDISGDAIAEAVAEQIMGSVMEEVSKYAERGAAVLQEACEKAGKGIGMIQASLIALAVDYSDDVTAEEVITETFEKARMALDGADEISGGATLVYQEAIRDARDVIAAADYLGIENEQIEQLSATLDECQDWEVYFISPDVDAQLDQAEAMALEVAANTDIEDISVTVTVDTDAVNEAVLQVEEGAVAILSSEEQTNAIIETAFDSAEQVVNQAHATAVMATQILQSTSTSALAVIDQAEAYGISLEELDAVKQVLEITQGAEIEILAGVTGDDLDAVEAMVKDAVAQAREIDTESLIATASQIVTDENLVEEISSATTIGEVLLVLQENGIELANSIYDEYTTLAAAEINQYLDDNDIELEDVEAEDSEDANTDDAETEELAEEAEVEVEEETAEEVEEEAEVPSKPSPDKDIVIVYTNDVHGAVADYSKVAAYKKQLEENGSYALLADGGDFIPDDNSNSFSAGLDLIDVMNASGYDVVSIGDHELDFGIRQLKRYKDAADFNMVCSNLVNNNTGESVLDGYSMYELGGVKVAFVGVVTPDEKNVASIKNFKADYTGYDVCGGETADLLIENVQGSIDSAKQEGADYVILISHLGINQASAPYTTQNVVAGLTGVDAVLGSHTHVAGKDIVLQDAEGNTIDFLRTGKGLQNVGTLTIGADGSISTDLVSSLEASDADVEEVILGLKD